MSKRRKIRVPREIVFLGYVLDAIIERDNQVIKVKNEWHNWFMCTSPGAERLSSGRSSLFLLDSGIYKGIDKKPSQKARQTYYEWTKNNPKQTFETGVPDDFPYVQGRIIRIGYASDKWTRRGRYENYDHDFYDCGGIAPIIRTDKKDIAKSNGAVIKGGSMRITSRGIA